MSSTTPWCRVHTLMQDFTISQPLTDPPIAFLSLPPIPTLFSYPSCTWFIKPGIQIISQFCINTYLSRLLRHDSPTYASPPASALPCLQICQVRSVAALASPTQLPVVIKTKSQILTMCIKTLHVQTGPGWLPHAMSFHFSPFLLSPAMLTFLQPPQIC